MTVNLSVHLPAIPTQTYHIFMEPDALTSLCWLPSDANTRTVVIITDSEVKERFAPALVQLLTTHGREPLLLSFPAGEQHKQAATKTALEAQLFQHRCGRDTLIIALGGGVVGDLAGFIAATYMRGIPYIQIPTTLLAMVDSSIGGKTAINTSEGKNLIGAFWHPTAVLIHLPYLQTLPQTHLIQGLVEAIKIFLAKDKLNFDHTLTALPQLLASNPEALITLIRRAIQLKAQIVEQDASEQNQRQILNFGHTIGHALEKVSAHTIPHGFAVAYGILVESKISQLLGILPAADYHLIRTLFESLGFQGRDLKPFQIPDLIQATHVDKKSRHQCTQSILLRQIGQIHTQQNRITHPIEAPIIKAAILAVIEESTNGR